MMKRILCVDDDTQLLNYYRTISKDFQVETADGPQQGLATLAERGPYAVVIADMNMPRMNGIQFLSRVRQLAPETVRIMVTGFPNLQVAVDAVNEGHIFRFLTKPCQPTELAKAIAAGLEQYLLQRAEKDLLEKTFTGAIQALMDVLALANPVACGRAQRVRQLAVGLATELKAGGTWQVEAAALLSQVGCVALPERLLTKAYLRLALSPEEARLFGAHPRVGHDLISGIPRLEQVAANIAYQEKNFDGTGVPEDGKKGAMIPLGARILKVALDFDSLAARERSNAKALACMKEHPGWYDPAVLAALEKTLGEEVGDQTREVRVEELRGGMVLADDVTSTCGLVIFQKGQTVTPLVLMSLEVHAQKTIIRQPIRVQVPLPSGAG